MENPSSFPTKLPEKYILKSTRVLIGGGISPGYLLVNKGRIQSFSIEKPEIVVPVFDCGNHVIMAGLVDPHVHINEPGRTHWEGFETATKAAAAGGITTLIEMPLNADPVTTTVENFELKMAASKGKTWVNCGFWGGLVPANVNNLEGLLSSGVFGLKAFLTHSGIDEFPNVGPKEIKLGLEMLKKNDLPLLVHCELEDGEDYSAGLSRNPKSYPTYLASRPDGWEVDAVQLMIDLCRQTGARTHIVHVSSAECLPLIRMAKKEGLPLTAETCPQYLVFSSEEIPDGDTRYKCAPPIRGKENNEKLWEALLEGTLDFVASDHSPAPPEMKEIESGHFKKAWGGISGLQFGLPLIWTFGRKRGFSISKIAQLLAENPAKLPGLENQKGKLEPGFDADIVVWNPESQFTIEEAKIQHRHKITPYQGMELYGEVLWTIVGGKTAWQSGQFSEKPPGVIIVKD